MDCLLLRSGRYAATLLLLSCSTAAAQVHEVDARLTHDVTSTINSYSRYTVFDSVSAQIDAGTVRLTGRVTLEEKKDELALRIQQLPGVRSVRNDVKVLRSSAADDTLRRRIARAIYGSPQFWRYAAQSNPPIHIVVENGSVVLTGTVAAESDRILADSLARGHGESSLVNELCVETDRTRIHPIAAS